ncbi:MAG: M48 family metalloprotease [Rhodobacteraceae bacterium]|nr:M48 family metalloprotease [Paracoccaceae bacterium]
MASRTLRGILAAAALALSATPLSALGLIRDAEIEATLDRIAAPLYRAAGISPGMIEILVVDDRSLNAFVVNNKAIFLHSGLITRLDTIAMLQSVIGHELAHITSGHLVRRSLNQASANSAIGIGVALAIALAASGAGDAASGVAFGAAGSAVRNYLSHTRAEEATADQVSVRYLVRAGVDPEASVQVLEIFRGQEALSITRQDPYALTHPLSADRIRALKGQIAIYEGKETAASADLVYWHARMQAKFRAFTGNPAYILRHIKPGDNSEAAIMTRAIAHYRQGDAGKAIGYMNQLLAKRPRDAFYHELKGQILLEDRQTAAAVASYRTADQLMPRQSLILAGYGRALLALKTREGDRQALEVLNRARQIDPRDARLLRDLAVAYAKAGNNGMASLVTAERYALLSRFDDAYTNANRAAGLLPRGSAGWLRAEDIIGVSKPLRKNRK